MRSWVEDTADGSEPRTCATRAELEELLERDAAAAGQVWLGQLVHGTWQVRPRAVNNALQQLVNSLFVLGLVRVVLPSMTGKTVTYYIAANRYFKGEPFPQQKRERLPREPEEEEELCDFEIERQRNIERNKALLRQLGLL
eukprot:CAMPEP_0119384588 /NCGR_PEP_ID=MMETSP1334-20130426/86267_1 /TAXON_ID=127549 /ORGANISM="Calcidiscus leptoporus, Strain RCC1130" /LENGTH=140 /DNA_ID=CAMNT_0007405633 /DNA_START=152 /DNA_END=574 /DNA_ORIENTATION=-